MTGPDSYLTFLCSQIHSLQRLKLFFFFTILCSYFSFSIQTQNLFCFSCVDVYREFGYCKYNI